MRYDGSQEDIPTAQRVFFGGLHVPRFPLKDSRWFLAQVYHCSSRVRWWEAKLELLRWQKKQTKMHPPWSNELTKNPWQMSSFQDKLELLIFQKPWQKARCLKDNSPNVALVSPCKVHAIKAAKWWYPNHSSKITNIFLQLLLLAWMFVVRTSVKFKLSIVSGLHPTEKSSIMWTGSWWIRPHFLWGFESQSSHTPPPTPSEIMPFNSKTRARLSKNSRNCRHSHSWTWTVAKLNL